MQFPQRGFSSEEECFLWQVFRPFMLAVKVLLFYLFSTFPHNFSIKCFTRILFIGPHILSCELLRRFYWVKGELIESVFIWQYKHLFNRFYRGHFKTSLKAINKVSFFPQGEIYRLHRSLLNWEYARRASGGRSLNVQFNRIILQFFPWASD